MTIVQNLPDQINIELKKKLNPKYVKTRRQGKATLYYIESWHAISEANDIFGFTNWSRETVYNKQVCQYPYVIGKDTQYQADGFKVGYEAKVLITIDGVTREGTGYGSGIAKDLFDAIESAGKEAESDAMKRALMTFGNRFGLALYDKTQANVGIDPPTPEEKRNKAEEWANNYLLWLDSLEDVERDLMNLQVDNAKNLQALASGHPDLHELITTKTNEVRSK